MKDAKKGYLLLIISIALTSCLFPFKNENKTQNEDMSYDDIESEIRNETIVNKSTQERERTKYFETLDESTGLVSLKNPFPSSWKKSKQQSFLFEGPNNVRVSGSSRSSFQFTNDQQIAWAWQQQGIQNVPPMSLDQIIQQFFMPVARQTGRTLTKTYPLPKLSRTMVLFYNQLFVSVPTQRDIKAYGLEWTDKNGISYITALIVNVAYSRASSSWGFNAQYLEAPNAHFNKAKNDFLYGTINVITNPQWVMACNKRDAQRAGVQLQAHLGRMAIINARVNTSKSVGDIYNEISDINHAGYLKRNDINSNGHSKTVRMVGERTIIGNHNTGEHYNVPDGSKYYWVNNDGKFIATDNSLFDPRVDKRINQMEWTQFQKEN